MQLLVLDKNFKAIDTLDDYESLIWTDRYCGYGDFEIYTLANVSILNTVLVDYYIWSDESEHVMIVESREIETDSENGHHLRITGRSLESILDRRIVWDQTILNGDIEGQLKRLLEKNIINPDNDQRKIPNFVFQWSKNPEIEEITIRRQFTGTTLYDAITDICSTLHLGYKITLNDQDQFVFQLYSGTDRSYKQETLPYVIFSPNFENLLESNYLESKSSWKNVALVAGEGEGHERKKVTTGLPYMIGLERRELFVDARDIQSTYSYENDDGEYVEEELPKAEYDEQLKQRGDSYLSDVKEIKTFDGEADPDGTFQYGKDYFIGDICQIENEYELQARVRVVEFVYSESLEGIKMYPTFAMADDSEDENKDKDEDEDKDSNKDEEVS